MNRLKERREAVGLLQADVSRELKAVEPRVDISMVSRYEQGVCLPTKAQLVELEKILGVDRTKLYEIEELDLLGIGRDGSAPATALTCGRPRKDMRSRQYYRKCFRIARSFEESLPEDLLQRCGYTSWQSWFDTGMRKLLAEYEAKNREYCR